MGTDNNPLSRGLRAAESKLKRYARNARAIGTQMVKLGASALLPFIGGAKVYANFADKMAVVRAVTGALTADFQKLEKEAKRLGRTTSFTASDVAGAMIELGRAGFKPQAILDSTQAVLNLARATDTELPLAAEIAAAALRGFSLKTKDSGRVADVLTAGANASAQTLEDLGESLKYVAPLAVEANASIEETVAALGLMANNGIKGSMAGTALARAYKNLATTGAQKTLQNIGVAAVDSAGDLRPLSTVLAELGEMTKAYGSGKRLAIFEKLFGRGSAAALKLAGGAGAFDDLLAKMRDAEGTANDVAQQMDDNLGGSFRRLMSAVEGSAIAVGEAVKGPFRQFTEWAVLAVGRVTEWIAANQKLVIGAAMAATALAATGVALIALSAAMSTVSFAIGGIATIATTIAGAFMAILSPIGLVSAAVAALGATLFSFTNTSGALMGWLSGRFGAFGQFASKTFGAVAKSLARGDITAAANVLWASLNLIWVKGASRLSVAIDSIRDKWTDFCYGMAASFNAAVSSISYAWTYIESKVAEIIAGLASLSGLDPHAVVKGVQEHYGKQLEDINNTLAAKLRSIYQDRDRAQAQADEKHLAALRAANKAIRDARKDWSAAINDAEAPPALREAAALPEKMKQAAVEIGKGIEGITLPGTPAGSRGTFNAAAVQSLQSGTTMDEKQLRELELANRHLNRIDRKFARDNHLPRFS